jgi:uncharacterized protein
MRIFEAFILGSVALAVSASASLAQQGDRLLPPRPIPNVLTGPPTVLLQPDIAAPAPGRSAGSAGSLVPGNALPLAPFSSARDALRAWMRDSSAGDQAGAHRALEYAASQGHLTAQYKLGRMHASGDGVPANELKAFEYFSKIADENADETPGSTDGQIVASAFVALGGYFLEGIKGTYVKPDHAKAFDMFHYAASYFRDPTGQYQLARLYLEGHGTGRDPRQAARWMRLSAEKGHVGARALFGDMLMRGGEGVPRQRALGLMWLELARDGAELPRDNWIIEHHQAAMAAASQSERDAARALLQRQVAGGAQPR